MNPLPNVDNIYLGPPGTNVLKTTNSGNIFGTMGTNKNAGHDRRESTDSIDEDSDGDVNLEAMDFDQWLQAYLAVKAELRDQAAADAANSYRELRRQFSAEQNILNDLYRTVEELADSVLRNDRDKRSIKKYSDWGKFRRKEFLRFMYNDTGFRAQYARHRFKNSAISLLQALILRILPETPQLEHFFAQVRYVVSVGVGPGSDIAGFIAYLRTRGYTNRITYFSLDQCEEWRDYIEKCDQQWRHTYNVSLWFKKAQISNLDSLAMLPDADMIVFSFSNTALMDPNIWPIIRSRYQLVMVLDGNRNCFIDVFSDCSYKYFQLNEKTTVYYHFNQHLKENSVASNVEIEDREAVVLGGSDSELRSDIVTARE